MDLKSIFTLSDVIKKNIDDGELPKETTDDMVISIMLPPQIFYGVDKEFYYMTHGNSYDGFVHSTDMVTANINGISFNFYPKNEEEKQV